MRSNALAPGVLLSVPAGSDGASGARVLQVLSRRPILDESADIGPPPAAEQRAQTVFETTGIVLVLGIVLAAAWILFRRRI